MPHLHTGYGEYDATVSAFIIRTDFINPKLLLHKHKKLFRVMQIGGHIEFNQHPWQAMKMEILQESRYDFEQLQVLQPKERMRHLDRVTIHPLPVVSQSHDISAHPLHFHTDQSFAFVTTGYPMHSIEEGESINMRWVTAVELARLPEAETFINVQQIGAFIFEHVLPNWEAVPANEFAT
jgi:8-oxo-dGTP pyrophosphatase MutT (NUDIX family)